MRTIKNIEKKISQLSPGLIDELDNYIDYLINKRIPKKPKTLKQDWAGDLKETRYTSISLQKKALDWR
ncbi:MAG: DUF2281 domain-containing protein [Bacteroidales bacterium]